MKKIAIALVITSLFWGCKNNPVSSESEETVDFTTWSSYLELEDVKTMYNEGAVFMSDARILSSIFPFSYRDSVLGGVNDTSVHYPYTRLEGTTRVSYRDSIIFDNSWNYSYMYSVRSMTTVKYGEVFDFKILRIKNESHDSLSGRYYLDSRLYIQNDNSLIEIDLKDYYSIGEIKQSNRHGVIILHSVDFVRTQTQYQHYILLDLLSKQRKVFTFKFP